MLQKPPVSLTRNQSHNHIYTAVTGAKHDLMSYSMIMYLFACKESFNHDFKVKIHLIKQRLRLMVGGPGFLLRGE